MTPDELRKLAKDLRWSAEYNKGMEQDADTADLIDAAADAWEATERELTDKDAMWRAADRELEEVRGNLLAMQRCITACGLNGVLNAWHEADIRGRRLSPSWLALHFHNLGEEQENSEEDE